jgi:hypothetical protein
MICNCTGTLGVLLISTTRILLLAMETLLRSIVVWSPNRPLPKKSMEIGRASYDTTSGSAASSKTVETQALDHS